MLTTSEIFKKYNFNTKKTFGQNFLLQENLLSKIVSFSDINSDSEILEVGAGLGSLTTAILKQKPKKLISIELDRECVDIINKEILPYFDNLKIINDNALLINEEQLFKNNFSIIANLPYNIGALLLLKWLKNCANKIDSMTLLLQKEVVDRIVAKSNTKEYGKLSILCQYAYTVKKCFDVLPSSFWPKPKVISTVVTLKLRKNIDTKILEKLFYVTSVLFSKKRKTIKNNLKNSKISLDIFDKIGINIESRAESLTIEDFVKIVKMFL